MAQVILRDLCKNFGDVQAVKNLNIVCEDGEFLAILGPSGCGKSTAMRMIAGLETVSSGEIYIGDRVVNDFTPKQRNIAMVFENYALYPHMTVFENIAFPLLMEKKSNTEVNKKVSQAMEMLRIDNIANDYPSTLSDGQKQRVGIGRAIVREPSLYLFDEPISHLDIMLRQEMRKEIVRLQKELNTTMIYVTHDQLEALTMGDRIAVMNDGVLQQLGTRDEILYHPRNTFVAKFVGEPPINLLDASVKKEKDKYLLELPSLQANMVLNEERSYKVLDNSNCKDITIGVRPLNINLYNQPMEGAFEGTVHFVEYLDEFNIFNIYLNSEKIIAEAPKSFKANIEDKIWLTLEESWIHFFDRDQGINLSLQDNI